MAWEPRLEAVRFENLSALSVPHAITTRAWGSLNPFVGYELGARLEAGLADESNRDVLRRVVFAEEIHGAAVHQSVQTDGGSIRFGVDGLLTDHGELILATYMADCFPIFLASPHYSAVGVLHAGRRGLAAGIVGQALERYRTGWGVEPNETYVSIGPGLRSCCYEIQRDIFPDIEAAGWDGFVRNTASGYYLDLPQAAHEDLRKSGVRAEHIEDCGLCTSCETDSFYSARRQRPEDEAGASLAALISPPSRPTA